MLLDYTVDQRNEVYFAMFDHQVNDRMGYISTWGSSGFLQASYIDGEPDPDPFNSPIDTSSLENFLVLNEKVSYQIQGICPF